MLFVFIMPAADKYFYPVKQIYVVTYFYLLNLYNTLWPAADNDPTFTSLTLKPDIVYILQIQHKTLI